jgi:hypothetical protein
MKIYLNGILLLAAAVACFALGIYRFDSTVWRLASIAGTASCFRAGVVTLILSRRRSQKGGK